MNFVHIRTKFFFMKKNIIIGLMFLGFIISLSACFKNPITGRKGLNLVDAGTMNLLANEQYATFLKDHQIQNNTAEGKMVQKVGERIASAVNKYLKENGRADLIKDFNWQFNYVNGKEINAWCMPGGKVVVYSGIMPITQGEKGLAVIMGHEIAHAVAHHGSERMSQGLLQQLGGVALAVAIKDKPKQTQQLFNNAYGISSNLGAILPFSRKHETEADEMGLIFMAMAGYDPAEAVSFWQRMNAQSNSANMPEFLSTHPSSTSRIEQLKKYLPKAQQFYKSYK